MKVFGEGQGRTLSNLSFDSESVISVLNFFAAGADSWFSLLVLLTIVSLFDTVSPPPPRGGLGSLEAFQFMKFRAMKVYTV